MMAEIKVESHKNQLPVKGRIAELKGATAPKTCPPPELLPEDAEELVVDEVLEEDAGDIGDEEEPPPPGPPPGVGVIVC